MVTADEFGKLTLSVFNLVAIPKAIEQETIILMISLYFQYEWPSKMFYECVKFIDIIVPQDCYILWLLYYFVIFWLYSILSSFYVSKFKTCGGYRLCVGSSAWFLVNKKKP